MIGYHVIFVPNQDIDEDKIEHHQIVDWANQNLTNSNVLLLTSDEVYLLQYETKILDIINEEINGMLQMGEDDWIIDADAKIRIRNRLSDYIQGIHRADIKKIIRDLIRLLDISILTEKNLYFVF